MECACISADIDEYSTVLFDKIVTARKEHTCDECREKIKIGDRHRVEKTLYDGEFEVFRTCLDCNSVREHLVCAFSWNCMWELVSESLRDFGNQQPWARIGRLTPKAREKVLDIIERSWDD